MSRFERKFRLRDRDRAYLLEYWRPFLARAPFTNRDAVYPVLSQYFDSPDLRCHRQKHDGIGMRRKYRLRTYGTRFREGGTCFLEIKRRWNDTISKHRVRLPGFRAEQLDPARWSGMDLPGMEPFCAARELHRLQPSAQVLYLREAYEAVAEKNLRITFDGHLTGLHPGEVWSRRLAYERSRRFLPETEFILEIKGPERLPRWVHRGIEWCELRQETVPKYIMAVEALNLVQIGPGVAA